MGADIDRLEVQVEAQATKANNQLDKLVGKLDRVSSALSNLNSGGLTGLSNGVAKFAQASAQLSNVKTADFTRLTKNIQSLANLNTQQIYGTASSMKTLSTAINSLGGASTGSMQIAQVADSISKLGGAGVQKAITNLPALATAVNNLMVTLSQAPQVSDNVIQMTRALANLSSQGAKVGTASNKLVKSLNSIGNSMSANTKKTRGFASVIGSLYQRFFWVSRGINKLWDSVEGSMGYVETLNYFDAAFGQVAETAVSQWETAGADSADAYYKSFSSRAKELTSRMTGFSINDDGTLSATGEASLGINPSKLMNYQAMFAQMSSSMGVSSETSLKLSQALTEIGADLASVKNMDFDKVWTDMASGLAGMSRTLDKYGVNIRNVNLQQKLLDLGINENITNLNQNDKALLRTIILLENTTYAWGDLADTLSQPANQMRLLESNISNLSRTLGNLFLPALSTVLPYVNGFVIAIQRLLTWVGNLMGIDLSSITSSIGSSEVDFSELLGDTEDLTGNLDDASNAAKKLKSNLQGFDELNVITTSDDSNGVGVGAGLSAGLLDSAFEDAFSEYQAVWDEAFASMENRAEEFADNIERYFQPIKDIINDFAIGDFFKAGQDTSNLVAGIFDFFSNAIDNVDWEHVGENIGEYLDGIEWVKVFDSAGNFFETAVDSALEMWKASYDEAPIETLVLTGWIGAKFLGLDKILWNKMSSALSASVLGHEIGLVPTITVSAITWVIGFDIGKSLGKALFPEDAEYYDNFKWFGEDGFFDTVSKDFSVSWDALSNMLTDEDNSGISALTSSLVGPLVTFAAFWNKYDVLGKLSELRDKVNEFTLGDDAQFFNAPIWKWDIKGYWNESLEPSLEDVKSDLQDWWTGIDTWWSENAPLAWLPEWFDDDVKPWFEKEKWAELGANAGIALSEEWNEFEEWWKSSGLYKWWNDDVAPFFDEDAWTWPGIKDGLEQAFENGVAGVKGIWNNFATWLNDKLNFSWDSVNILGQEIIPSGSITLGTLPTFYTGGFPEDGLFMANHNELVGQFSNGKTAVANNQQITEGIAIAVQDGNYEQNQLLREQNELLRAILEKETGITYDQVGKAAKQYAKEYYNRTGRPAY